MTDRVKSAMPDEMNRAADPRDDHLDRRVQVVTGKGGVGRTTVSAALAVDAAGRGLKTLLLEVDAPDSAARLLGVEPAVDMPREIEDRLWLCRMTPQGSQREYALMILKFRALYTFVFENPVVRYLLRSIPSLAEFTMLGKAWFHSSETDAAGNAVYDRIIIDAPATGHAITFLALARTVAEVSPAGRMREASERMARMVEDPDETCMHVVTLPEEMPVNEGLELVMAARGTLRMAPGIGVVNRMLPPLLRDGERAVWARLAVPPAGLDGPDPVAPYVGAARFRLEREALQEEHAGRFARDSGLVTRCIRDFGPDGIGREHLDEIAAHLRVPDILVPAEARGAR